MDAQRTSAVSRSAAETVTRRQMLWRLAAAVGALAGVTPGRLAPALEGENRAHDAQLESLRARVG